LKKEEGDKLTEKRKEFRTYRAKDIYCTELRGKGTGSYEERVSNWF